ncbi:MAG: TAXI family TRAP transporter solute-binding subunit [Cyanobacteria bacterium J06554_1]
MSTRLPAKLTAVSASQFERSPIISRSLLFFLGGSLFIGSFWFLSQFLGFGGPQLVLAAGNKTGESYLFSRALKVVVEANSSIRLDVCATDGTDDNIRALERSPLVQPATCTSGHSASNIKADVITAQADRLYYSLIPQPAQNNANSLPPASAARAIAVLYQDHFQMLVDPKKISIASPDTADLSKLTVGPNQLNGKKIATPEGGGQRPSLKTLSDHFNFPSYLDIDLSLSNQASPQDLENTLESNDIAAVFRVRRLGNSRIQQLIAQGWQPIAIPQANALENTTYPAYRPSLIPQGTYQGSPPVPPIDLETIAIDRLLVAHQSLPKRHAQTLTKILFEHQQELRDTLAELVELEELRSADFEPETVVPLVSNVAAPSADTVIPTHRGTTAFFTPFQLPFVIENADFFALLITLFLMAYSGYVSFRNNQANQQIKLLVELMKKLNIYDKPREPDDTNWLTARLVYLSDQHEALDKAFQFASSTLGHEGFRAFSETYKSAREMIEREIEERQRRFSSLYVDAVVELMTKIQAEGTDLKTLSNRLDRLFFEAGETLTKEDIFSRESFQTFTEAYEIARETIERKKREQLS